MIIVNGCGYDELINAYSKGDISSRTEIIAGFEYNSGFLRKKKKETKSLAFDNSGVLKYLEHVEGGGRLGKPVTLEDLIKMGSWGAVSAKQKISIAEVTALPN